jgi:hypothetical protein
VFFVFCEGERNMKKLAFSVFAAALTFGGVSAADEVPAAESCCGYDGFYFGLGIGASNGGIKTETTASYLAGAERPQDVGVDSNDHDTKFIGTAVLGFGKRIQEKTYLALEAGLDASQSSNFNHPGNRSVDNKVWETRTRSNGLIPSVGLRLGYVHPATRGMIYLKAGAAYSKSRAWYEDCYFGTGTTFANFNDEDVISYEGKCAKWSPIIALGAEKLCGKNLRTRLEVEYRFAANKKFDFNNADRIGKPASGTGVNVANDYHGTVKLTNKNAITLRAMAIYTVRM